ncbi:biliverdin-producing heme oxygenase [Massilia sp. Root335]|uniref:biliverdin-producing heme oxygenase n=1 Tax=Massilia sp. Root335 TaxID=1736517 RepID=UPI0006FAE126|nr:biliverdin-producing heme oxygenase [Massilia sp. Root335]KQV41005.1 heme oxygenase [Massilia sp. Root335]
MTRSLDAAHAAAHAADPLAALRAATATRHAALDSGLPIGAPDASLDDYTAHLALLRAWLGPLHAWLAGFADGPAFDHGAWLGLIETDLAEAGVPVHGARDTLTDAWPAGASPAYRWGVHYVIEGSQLGGAVLYGRLRARLAPHRLRYLKGDAGGPGPRWRAFMQALRANVRTPAEIADACAGACAAFDRILELRADPHSEIV